MARFASCEDFRRAAQRRLPRILFDYLDGGASGETTMAANIADLAQTGLEPRALRDVSSRSLDATFLGVRHAMPVMLGPVGSLGLFRAGSEAAAFRAGVSACLSSFAVTRPEDLPHGSGSDAFQLYVLKDRGRTGAILERVAGAGFGTLFVTVDTAVSGIRERDLRNGLRRITRPDLRILADLASHPHWCVERLRHGLPAMMLAEGWPEAGGTYLEQAAFLAGQIDPAFDRSGLGWLRARWRGRLVVKGILCAQDARIAVDCGADAVVVSNHGGRQLDGARSTIRALPEVAEAVSGRADILFDGGIRRGGDVLKALQNGADACLLGRAYAYALAADGEEGLAVFLRLLAAELDAAAALCGITSLDGIAKDRGNGLKPPVAGTTGSVGA
ncbi:FMN-dependent dehydrogenase [Aquamicrobium defluvii]|uniref:FMN-dependent dehydrogenase n=1 Tax=Aquamicrobium defluvii TaxID=69279 RepID=A0A011UKL4_9HYPH|nr:FMN-dependent dehydrogenase [Aquamicrobium defluvii]EZQ15817.1 FMN-dependent dehydrogenase [Halopseudomonas bauzanensis]